MFPCSLCEKRFTRKNYVSIHVRTVHDKKREYQCHKCAREFGEAGLLRRHMRLVHADARPFKCHVCGAAFKSRPYLDAHLAAVHAKAASFACDECDKTFRWKGDVNRHKKSEHGQVKRVRCETCHACYFEKGTPSKRVVCGGAHGSDSTTDNAADEDADHRLPCELCGAVFRQRLAFKKHQDEMHRRLFPCDSQACEESFNDKVNLELHSQVNHRAEAKKFVCQHCTKGYDLKSSLNRHVRKSHAGSSQSNIESRDA